MARAMPALWSAAADDPLRAGLESVFHAMVTFGIGYRRLLSEVRDAFPELAERDPAGGRRPSNPTARRSTATGK